MTSKTKGFFCHFDVKENNVTCTTTVRPEINGKIIINGKSFDFKELGFSSLKVSDYHHGEHSKNGCILSINKNLTSTEMHYSEISPYILSNL